MTDTFSIIPPSTGESYDDFVARTDRRVREALAPLPRDPKTETLRQMLGWIEHWQEDAKCGLAPTSKSLEFAHQLLSATLKR